MKPLLSQCLNALTKTSFYWLAIAIVVVINLFFSPMFKIDLSTARNIINKAFLKNVFATLISEVKL